MYVGAMDTCSVAGIGAGVVSTTHKPTKTQRCNNECPSEIGVLASVFTTDAGAGDGEAVKSQS